MAYEKQNFLDGQIVTADHLNHIEDGIIAAGNPRNLLDNSDFTNPVAQTGGVNGMHGNHSFVVDRWVNGSNAPADIQNDGLVVDGATDVYQNLERYDVMAGKMYTIALKTFDGIYCASFVMGSVPNGIRFSDKIYFFSVPGLNVLFRQTGWNKYVWAALYEGSYTADTLPPYVPKGYAAELTECRRYYRRNEFLNCAKTSGNYFSVSASIEMRVVPTAELLTFAPYGLPTITDMSGCSVTIAQSAAGVQRITYANLPTCAAHSAGGLAVNLSADL